jgi:hypothetical protein
MLSILMASITPGLRRRPPVFQADMKHFSLKRTFPLILMPCNTLSALPDHERPAVFGRIAGHLSPGGVFAASLPNPEILRSLPSSGDSELEDGFTHPVTGNPVQVSSAWSKDQTRLEVRWHYDHLFPDGSVARCTASVAHSLARVEVFSAELSSAGLKIDTAQGDFDGSAWRPDSPYLILICKHAD